MFPRLFIFLCCVVRVLLVFFVVFFCAVSCVPNVASVSGLSFLVYLFIFLCCVFFLLLSVLCVLMIPLLPVSLDCPFLIIPLSSLFFNLSVLCFFFVLYLVFNVAIVSGFSSLDCPLVCLSFHFSVLCCGFVYVLRLDVPNDATVSGFFSFDCPFGFL